MYARNETSFCPSRHSRDFLDVPLLGMGINGYRILRIDLTVVIHPFVPSSFILFVCLQKIFRLPFYRVCEPVPGSTGVQRRILESCPIIFIVLVEAYSRRNLEFHQRSIFLNRSIFYVSLIPFASVPFVAAVELTRIPLFTMNPFKSKKRR